MATMTGEDALVPPVEQVAATTCGCGQALDVCRTGHCPRCGAVLHH